MLLPLPPPPLLLLPLPFSHALLLPPPPPSFLPSPSSFLLPSHDLNCSRLSNVVARITGDPAMFMQTLASAGLTALGGDTEAGGAGQPAAGAPPIPDAPKPLRNVGNTCLGIVFYNFAANCSYDFRHTLFQKPNNAHWLLRSCPRI